MPDVYPYFNEPERVDGNDQDEQGRNFFSGFLRELQSMVYLNGLSAERTSDQPAATQFAQPAIGDSSAQLPPVEQPVDRAPQNDQTSPNLPDSNFDPYGFGGDTKGDQTVPPFNSPSGPLDNQSGQNPPPMPEKTAPADPAPSGESKGSPTGDQQAKWGDRTFSVHPDGSADYAVKKGDCVWFVAIDVLKERTGQKPDDASIIAQVNAIAEASGLTKNGRNPNLIYPGDKLVIPPAQTPDDPPGAKK